MFDRLSRRGRFALAGLAAAALAVPAIAVGRGNAPGGTRFELSANPALTSLSCLAQPGHTPRATVTVRRGSVNDTLTLRLRGFRPGLAFDLFTVERSPFDPGFAGNFGLSWYQSDVAVGSDGTSTTKIKTVLLDQVFGFAAGAVNPTHTFHVGFWFHRPHEASGCIASPAPTPFNGEQDAGPNAFISRPNPRTHLGPLCTTHSPDPGTATPSCT